MRRFFLLRSVDETGCSGTGRVAEGAELANGRVILSWTPTVAYDLLSEANYPSMDVMERIHGHKGKTTVEWIDPPPLVLADRDGLEWEASPNAAQIAKHISFDAILYYPVGSNSSPGPMPYVELLQARGPLREKPHAVPRLTLVASGPAGVCVCPPDPDPGAVDLVDCDLHPSTP